MYVIMNEYHSVGTMQPCESCHALWCVGHRILYRMRQPLVPLSPPIIQHAMTKPISHSSGQTSSLQFKLSEWAAQFGMRVRGMITPDDFTSLFEDLNGYDEYLRKYSAVTLQEASVLEVGYGARPLRLIALISMGVNARGVDLDQPCLTGNIREIIEMSRRNGGERAFKSAVRMLLFDKHERHGLSKALRKRKQCRMNILLDRFVVDDATSEGFSAQIGPGTLDFIFSEDVFEHIPESDIQGLVRRMSMWLKPTGIAIINPDIWTGITGGHLTEWYHGNVEKPLKRESEPWEHLRKRRFEANTYMNQMSRASYRDAFSKYFDILEEVVKMPHLGAQYLTEEVRQELKGMPDDELFSNNVVFVLRRKP